MCVGLCLVNPDSLEVAECVSLYVFSTRYNFYLSFYIDIYYLDKLYFSLMLLMRIRFLLTSPLVQNQSRGLRLWVPRDLYLYDVRI